MRPATAITTHLAERPLLTTFVAMHDPTGVGLIAAAGFDGVVIDQEHGTMPISVARNLILAAHAAGLYAFVRPPDIRRGSIQDALEAGADGLLAPMVETPEQARALVDWSHYPPEGSRGFHPLTGASSYSALPGGPAARNASLFVAAQIETARGLANLDAIAAVPGLDALFLGPGDLSLSLGVAPDAPELHAALTALASAAQAKFKQAGTWVAGAPQAAQARALGVRWLVAGGDAGMLLQAARGLASDLRGQGA